MNGDAGGVQRRERLAGLLLIAGAAIALLLANSSLAGAFHDLLDMKLGPPLPRFGVLSVHQWVADGLMAIFFLLVGLEVKREWYDGQLASPAQRRLPILAAAGGVAVPAVVYLLATGFNPMLARGWAIPAATDIAFAVGVLALLGSRANPAIKLLLVTIAIVDDVAAVLIIALAYTSELDSVALAGAAGIVGALAAMSLLGVRRLWPFLLGFGLLWLAMLASGIHPTLAGILGALTVPLGRGEPSSPLKRLEHLIHPWVAFGIMPLFGLVSAGVQLGSAGDLFEPLALAVLLGLFLGKQVGVFGTIWLMVRLRLAARPGDTGWGELYGASLLCGIGFTMSLFIGALAFPGSPGEVEAAKLGTLAGSLLSAVCGWSVLRLLPPTPFTEEDRIEASELFGSNDARPG